MKLELNHITKSFSGKKILRNFNLTIQSGEFVGIVGKSGSIRQIDHFEFAWSF